MPTLEGNSIYMSGSFIKWKPAVFGAVALTVAIAAASGGAYAFELYDVKGKAQELQDTAIASQGKLLHAYTEHDNAPESKYGVNDVVAGDEGKFVLNAYKTSGENAKKTLADNSYAVPIDQLTMKELNAYISETQKDNAAKLHAVKSLHAAESSIAGSHRLRLVADAQSKLKTSVDNANTTLKDSDGKVDDNTPRQQLQDAVNEASKHLHENDVKALQDNAANVDGKVQAVKDAVQARDTRIANEEAARQAAAASQASYNGGGYAIGTAGYTGGNGGYAGRYGSYSSAGSSAGSSYYNGFSVGGSCSLDAADHCQGAVDGGGYNSLTHLTDGAGTNIYAIHSGYGGSSTWGQNSITINGQTHTLGAPFQTNISPNDGKQYFQTCGPDGRVYLRQMS